MFLKTVTILVNSNNNNNKKYTNLINVNRIVPIVLSQRPELVLLVLDDVQVHCDGAQVRHAGLHVLQPF